MSDLVENLRQFIRKCPVELFSYNPEKTMRDLARDAVGALEQKDAEIKRLRACLRETSKAQRDEIERLKEYHKEYIEQAMAHRDEAERLWHQETKAEIQRLKENQDKAREWFGFIEQLTEENKRLRGITECARDLDHWIIEQAENRVAAIRQKEAKDA